MPGILSFIDARHAVEEQARSLRGPSDVEVCDLLTAPGRILAERVSADRDLPPFPRATRDGFALRAADLGRLPAKLHVVGEIRAGAEAANILVNPGEAAEIMTGAPAPPGADAVVMVEYTSRRGDSVEVQRAVKAGENIVPTGSEARQGQALLEPGARVDPAAIAVAASVGKTELRVFVPPRVAILATGDEIVDVAAQPGAAQIRNSNSYSLAAQVTQAGGEAVLLPVAPDEAGALRHLVEQGLAYDLLLLSGGVSAGKYDLVEPVLEKFGAEVFFSGAEIQPGRPILFGRARRNPGAQPTYFFGLPGNPTSTLVTFELFVRPLLTALSGGVAAPLAFMQARLGADVKTKTGLTRFLPAVLSGEFANAEVRLAAWKGSGDVAGTARANCFLIVPPDRDHYPAGEWVSVLRVG